MSNTIVRVAAICVLATGLSATADVTVRVATFNIENFNGSDPDQLNAAVDILIRIGADVVCLQEINDDPSSALEDLAAMAGYPHRFLASGSNSFDGDNHAAVISMYPFASPPQTLTSANLSPDPNARDITRNFVVAVIDVPNAAEDLVIIGNHWKSGTQNEDEFRRSIESIRAMQATSVFDSAIVPYVLVGDMNDDINDSPDSPDQFFSEPAGMPVGFSLGSDISFPVTNSVFAPLQAGAGSQNLTVINARQKDNSDATRISGRRIDYIWHSDAVEVLGSEVYDSADEGLPGGLPKFGSPLSAGVSGMASDHLPVFADVAIADDQSGACCTECGCVDTLNEAECLEAGGEFRGALVPCGSEVPACEEPPNDMIINEFSIVRSGSQSDMEFIEIFGTPGTPLCGLSLIAIEGETLSKGRVDLVENLGDCGGEVCRINSNGYFVAGDLAVNPDLVIPANFFTDLFENGTQTLVLVRNATVSVGVDIDAPNPGGDGIADFLPGVIVDAVGIIDNDYPASDAIYYDAPLLGPDSFASPSVPAGGARCPNGFDSGASSDWVTLGKATDGSDGCVPFTPGQPNPANCGGDYNGDGMHDLRDFAAFQECIMQANLACSALELDGLCGITLDDYEIFSQIIAGP